MNDGDQKLFEFDNTYIRDLPELGVEWKASEVPTPELVAFNRELASDISVDPELLESADGVAVLAGNVVPLGAAPFAMVYAGHQFGGYSPRLGDGRALLLGEVLDGSGSRIDLHLKGSGRTPFARGGDGKATVGPMLREYLIAEAMHALGIPTGRALAVVTTGEQVMRERPEPGAVLTRVAASHLRVGTFEYAARLEDESVLKRLADYAIARHYPGLAESEAEQPYLAFFDAVVDAQASLIARWMLVGFIHGVMNTDNTTISGQTIDYGPCAFMDRYDQATVYSSIDHQGRYAYGNQPTIAQWNLARLAETLIPLIAADAGIDNESAVPLVSDRLNRFPELFRGYWADGMRAKLGLTAEHDDDPELFGELLQLLQSQRADYTSLFRALADLLRDNRASLNALIDDVSATDAWTARWHDRVNGEGRSAADVAAGMDAVNPIYIPRNHLVDEALEAATGGDLAPFNALLDVVTDPYVERDGLDRYAEPAPESFDQTFRTYCGT